MMGINFVTVAVWTMRYRKHPGTTRPKSTPGKLGTFLTNIVPAFPALTASYKIKIGPFASLFFVIFH